MEELKGINEEKTENLSSQEEKEETYSGVFGFVMEIIKIVFLAFIIIVPVRVFLFQPFFVQGASMEPNFEDREYLIVNEFGYKETDIGTGDRTFFKVEPFKELKRQEVIVFRYPKNHSQFFIKRIIGLPGERVLVKDGQVTIFNDQNPEGFNLDESTYLGANVKTMGDMVLTMEKDEYFVMGDNRMFSSDSRAWGPIKETDVIGKVLLRAWPLDRMEIF